jgi:hypothetical protein
MSRVLDEPCREGHRVIGRTRGPSSRTRNRTAPKSCVLRAAHQHQFFVKRCCIIARPRAGLYMTARSSVPQQPVHQRDGGADGCCDGDVGNIWQPADRAAGTSPGWPLANRQWSRCSPEPTHPGVLPDTSARRACGTADRPARRPPSTVPARTAHSSSSALIRELTVDCVTCSLPAA